MDKRAKPVAVVLGAAVWEGGVASPTLARRTAQAVDLWQAGKVSGVIACGGVGQHAPSEAQVIKELCLAAGLPQDAVILEENSTTTEENLRFARPLLEGAEALIVTDAWHGPRALLVARRLGIVADVSPVPWRGAKLGPTLKAIAREAVAFPAYAFSRRGR